MPIYEFYCQDCHTLYSFFSSRLAPERRPDCPRCERRELERRPSRFATLKRRDDEGEERDPLEGLDETRLEGAMGTLMGEMEGINEEDPRAMGHMMRRFSELTGLELGGQMAEMVSRMEAGENPERLEQEMEESFGEDESFEDLFRLKKALAARRSRRPRVDEELYFL
jgi:putative FmdB family regulatory protein